MKRPVIFFILFIIVSFLSFSPRVSQAANITINVDDSTDTTNLTCPTLGTSPCSLRDAIAFANLQASPDTVTITLQPSTTYLLTNGQLGLITNAPLTINGGNAADASSSKVDGNQNDRVFDINNAVNATFNNFTIQNGRVDGSAGGGILNFGKLTLSNIILTGNSTRVGEGNCAGNGGGIANEGMATLTINNSTISNNTANHGPICPSFADGNGGGIFNVNIRNQIPTITIDNSLIINNQAMASGVPAVGGGGIYNVEGNVNIVNGSTLSGNTAPVGLGGGIYHTGILGVGTCGNIPCPHAILTIENTTISGNSSLLDGGGIYRDNPMTLTNVTISGNSVTGPGEGGGIYNNGAGPTFGCNTTPPNTSTCIGTLINVTIAFNSAPTAGGISANDPNVPPHILTVLKNTLLAQNAPGGNCDSTDPVANITSQDFNLSDDSTCATFLTQANDLPPSTPANIGALANNGGNYPSNPPFTHALLTGSLAINAILPANCTDITGAALTQDERGFLRPGANLGPNCDIGAFEAQGTPPIPPIPPTPVILDVLEGGGMGCGRQSIMGAETGSSVQMILLILPVIAGFAVRRKKR